MLSLAMLLATGGTSMAKVDHTHFDQVRQCTGCHPRLKPTHWQQMPEDMQTLLPLDKKGRMVCTTCHVCTKDTCELREPKEELCRSCHDCTQGMACVLGTAHLGNSKDIKMMSTDLCLGCHDQVGTPQTCALGNRVIHTMVLKPKGSEGEGRPVSLVDGEVTCISCHNPYTANDFAKLNEPRGGSELCATCHAKLDKFDHTGLREVKECITCHPRVQPTHVRQKPDFMTQNLPLDKTGRMMCITCHICVKDTCTIRGPKEQLCRVCHDCARGMACLIGTPHLGNDEGAKQAAINACRECHDSSVAPDVCPQSKNMAKNGETCLTCHEPYSGHKTALEASKGKDVKEQLKNMRLTYCPRNYIDMTEADCTDCHIGRR